MWELVRRDWQQPAECTSPQLGSVTRIGSLTQPWEEYKHCELAHTTQRGSPDPPGPEPVVQHFLADGTGTLLGARTDGGTAIHHHHSSDFLPIVYPGSSQSGTMAANSFRPSKCQGREKLSPTCPSGRPLTELHGFYGVTCTP